MRTAQSRFAVDKLFVLGAGASYSATRPNKSFRSDTPPQKQTPLDKQFTSVLANLRTVRPAWVSRSVDLIRDTWRDHVSFTSLGLEEALIVHGANLQFVNAIHTRKRKNSIDIDTYLNNMAHLITFHLRRAREGREKCYSCFATKFFDSVDAHNRIITFNYDDVLDRTLFCRASFTSPRYSRDREQSRHRAGCLLR